MENGNKVVCVMGRDVPATSVLVQLLSKNGFFMGEPLEQSGDFFGEDGEGGESVQKMIDSCRIFGKTSFRKGGGWDFKHPLPPQRFIDAMFDYLRLILEREDDCGWKLTEAMMIYPWAIYLFPDMYYVYVIRDPRDSILTSHQTDSLELWNVPYRQTNDVLQQRAYSWRYQYDIVHEVLSPFNLFVVRYEDMVLKMDTVLRRLSSFLGKEIRTQGYRSKRDTIGRWRSRPDQYMFECFRKPLAEYEYK